MAPAVTETYYYGNYTPVGDILVTSICFVFLVLMATAYIAKSRTYLLFRLQLFVLVLAAFASITFHVLLSKHAVVSHNLIHTLYAAYHSLLYLDLFLYLVYIKETMHLGRKTLLHLIVPVGGITLLVIALEFLSVPFDWGLHITDSGAISDGANLFYIGYPLLCAVIFYLLIRYRKRIYKQVMRGIFGSSVISFVILFIQMFLGVTSYTVATFLFPALAVLYLMHSNPYDLEMGAVDASAFDDMVVDQHDRKHELILMSVQFPELDDEGKQYPNGLKGVIRHFTASFFRGATMFQVTNGRLVLVADKGRNPDYENIVNKMLNAFEEEYPKFKLPFKIVILYSVDQISVDREYVKLIRFAESKMKENEVRYLTDEDVEEYQNHKYILSELQDICKGERLDDPRVEVFCQPVYNIASGRYDMAEALMRLKLPELGRVFPDVFIPIAEEHQFIHHLSLIILHKTCVRIKEMLDQNYNIMRISVNISALELRDDNFCADMDRIIRDSGIPFEKIAIELTESRSESDFMIMKAKINELKKNGIKFYLDDFGTGYSNFERIMELPFDIIKFDRSLVIASAADQKSEMMVSHLAQMFSDLNYAVLYEGVENVDDELRCMKMEAKFLQGYKYTRPIPIEKLTDYFDKGA